MKTLEEKLLEICDTVKLEVSRPPKTETERGFQLATLRMCAMIRKEILVHKKEKSSVTYTKEEFISLLERLESEHDV